MIVCFICRRERKPEQLDGRRCADHDACLRAAARAWNSATIRMAPRHVLKQIRARDRARRTSAKRAA